VEDVVDGAVFPALPAPNEELVVGEILGRLVRFRLLLSDGFYGTFSVQALKTFLIAGVLQLEVTSCAT